ncbi:hypothetical protein B0H21DRAFT_781685 [Amylocystis lapponica]|nr:hypothetical protein B0H21DRAFT_781685 [Amylocystis lapponica]
MTATLERLKAIITKPQSISRTEYAEVPGLLRRVKHLLRVYYDAKLSNRKPVEFKYCDVQDVSDVGLKLHRLGLLLQLAPARLRALLSYGPDMDTFVIDETIDIGRWRLEAQRVADAVAADPKSDGDDRRRVVDLRESSDDDFAAFNMVYFVADILVAFILVPPIDNTERSRAERAMTKLVEYSTSPMWRRALGDPLSDAMRPIYWSKPLTLRFVHAGGFPALFDDWAQSIVKDLCTKSLKTLPSIAWEHQTEASLKGVMAALITKVELDGDEVAATPLVAQAMHEIYSRYGLAPFDRASTLSGSTVLVYFLHRRIARRPDAYRTPAAMLALLTKYKNVPWATRKRHGWMIHSVSARWNCLETDNYGCKNAACSELKELKAFKAQRVRGVRDPVVEDRLFRWGGACKACTSCRFVSYCSTSCQRADWQRHKPECRERTARDQTQVEVEI